SRSPHYIGAPTPKTFPHGAATRPLTTGTREFPGKFGKSPTLPCSWLYNETEGFRAVKAAPEKIRRRCEHDARKVCPRGVPRGVDFQPAILEGLAGWKP